MWNHPKTRKVSLAYILLNHRTTSYFYRLHHAAPMLHQARYVASLQLSPDLQPPACLQYAVMASGAWTSSEHRSLAVILYEQARALAEADEAKVKSPPSFARMTVFRLVLTISSHCRAIKNVS